MGKTSLAMNIAESAVLESRRPTAVFSMEMKFDEGEGVVPLLHMLCSARSKKVQS